MQELFTARDAEKGAAITASVYLQSEKLATESRLKRCDAAQGVPLTIYNNEDKFFLQMSEFSGR